MTDLPPVRLSIAVTDYSWDVAAAALRQRLTELAQAADAAGLDTVWVADHLLQVTPGHDLGEPMLEAFTTLGYLAYATTRVRLGTMVAAATFRAPALLVKCVSTLDVLSGGRAWLGIGAGYQLDEARAMGLDLPPVPDRFARLGETLQIATAMFADDARSHVGSHHRLENPVNHPVPISRPRPPILVGGTGERHTLRLVARYADACNLFDIPDDGATIRHKLDVLRRHCDDLDRDYSAIDKTVSTRWESSASVADLEAQCARLAGYGATHLVLLRPSPWTPGELADLAPLVGRPAEDVEKSLSPSAGRH